MKSLLLILFVIKVPTSNPAIYMYQSICRIFSKPTLGLSGLVRDKEPSSPDPAARNAPNDMRTSPILLGSLTPTTLRRDGLVIN